MTTALTLHERKALAEAAARRLRQRAEQTADRQRRREWAGWCPAYMPIPERCTEEE